MSNEKHGDRGMMEQGNRPFHVLGLQLVVISRCKRCKELLVGGECK